MKPSYSLSKLAIRDINDIFEYSLNNWSRSKANKYYKDIFRTIELICKNPQIGNSIHELKSDHRLKSINSHLIIYKVLDGLIYVDRILHKRMDIEKLRIE